MTMMIPGILYLALAIAFILWVAQEDELKERVPDERMVLVQCRFNPDSWRVRRFDLIRRGDVFMLCEADGSLVENDGDFLFTAMEDAKSEWVKVVPL
jgi:hypothetical protein